MRILIVSPGPKHSTYDIFSYYLDAMRDTPEIKVQPFNFHNIITWQAMAAKCYKPELTEVEVQSIGLSRASRELLVDVITFEPDIVFVVSGLMLSEFTWTHLVHLRSKLNKKFVIATYFTESPYLDAKQLEYARYPDVLFINDKQSLRVFDPDDNKHVHYLPHSYNPKVHKNNRDDSYKSDVFFTATPFYERGMLLAGVNWDGIDFKLGGNWIDYCRPEDYLKLHPYIFSETTVDNDVVAKYYANTKIGLNIHRTRPDIEGMQDEIDNHKDAYSIGPRPYEIAACGALLLTDYRQEAMDIFGNSIAYFTSAGELNNQIRFWLSDKAEASRIEKIQEAQERVKNCTFKHRLDDYILPVFEQVMKYI